MTTPPMTHVGQGTMGSTMVATASAMPAATSAVKRSKPTAPAVIATASTPTAMPTAPTSATMPATASTPTAMPPSDCRDVRHDAKRAHRNACRQNAYRSLLHGTFPTRSSKAVGVAARNLAPSNI